MKSLRFAGSLLGAVFVGFAAMLTAAEVAPTISTQPAASQVVDAGGAVALSVEAVGDGAVSFQWLLNGILVPGTGSALLTIPSTSYRDAGYYQARVTDATGSVLSATAFLNVAVYGKVMAWGNNAEGQTNIPQARPGWWGSPRAGNIRWR